MSEVVVLNRSKEFTVATVASKTRQPCNFEWDVETYLLFLQAVQVNNANIKSSDKLEVT